MNERIHPRAREVVKLAASQTKVRSLQLALTEDPRGVFEIEASSLLNNERARALMVEKGMTEDDLVNEAAQVLLLAALRATQIVVERSPPRCKR